MGPCNRRPFADSNVSNVIRVTRHDRSRAVLKLNYPEAETEREPDALRYWAGLRAARLLAHTHDLRAILMERVEPADPLRTQNESFALETGAEILREFRRPAP